MQKAKIIDVARNPLNYTLLPIDPKTGNILSRFRRLNENRACAMRAIFVAMLYYYGYTITSSTSLYKKVI